MSELVKEIIEAEETINKLEDYIRASVAGYSSPKGIAMLSPIRNTLQRARKALAALEEENMLLRGSVKGLEDLLQRLEDEGRILQEAPE